MKYTIDTDSENEDDPKKFSELSSLSEASSGTEWTPPKFLVCAYSEDFKFTFIFFVYLIAIVTKLKHVES